MKNKKSLSLVCSIVILCSCFFGACGGNTKVEDLYVPEYEKGATMRVMADLPPDASNKASLELYKSAGFTAIPITEDFFSAADVAKYGETSKYIRALNNCEEVGLEAFIRPHSSYVSKTLTTDPNYYESYFSTIDFHDYPAVKGFYMVDEPVYSQFQDLETRYVSWFNNNYGDGNYEIMANLFACHNAMAYAAESNITYDDYATRFLDILNSSKSRQKYHSIDYYTLRIDGTSTFMYETNLLAHIDAATRAANYGFGFAAYVQAFGGEGDGNTYRLPTSFGEINWGLYNILQFGASQIKYFGYRDFEQGNLTCMITEGEPNERYYWVKQANENLKKFEHVLLAYQWQHIYTNVGTGSRLAVNEAFEYVRSYVKPITDVEKVVSKYDITLNEFKDKDNNKAFMLFNYDDPIYKRKNKVVLNFGNADGVMYYRNGESNIETLTNHEWSVELDSGEGIFVIPLYKK